MTTDRGSADRGSADRGGADRGGADQTGVDQARGGRWPMADRSILATVLGVPPAAAVGLAAALTTLGVFADLTRIGRLGLIFTVCYVVGCVLAVAWVRRTGLFGPMATPPLLLAVAVPVVVLLATSPQPGAGLADRLLVIVAPLVNSFPTMAWTTGIVLALGAARLVLQRPLDDDQSLNPVERAARGAARTSRSPRRS